MFFGNTSWCRRLLRFAALLALALGNRPAAGEEAVIEQLQSRFKPLKPTVHMEYRVSYHLLGMELKRMALAGVEATEGEWRDARGDRRPACLVNFQLDTLEPGKVTSSDRRGVFLHNRIATVLDMPGLNAIEYVKRSNQRIYMLRQKKILNNLEVYNLESGALQYNCHDYLTGTDTTNLTGKAELTRQGKEVSVFLKLIAEAYQSDKPASLCDPKRPVYIYTDGDLVPFALRIRDRKTNLAILNTVVPALYLKAHPTKDARGKGREFEMWTASFLDVSEKTREKGLIALAHDSLSWSMIPLIIDLGLPIGTIRGVLSDMRIVSPTPAPRAGDTPPNPSGTPPRAATSSKPQS